MKPIAPKGMKCPLYRKDLSKVCHTCEWYVHVRGMNPQTGEEVDRWGCSMNIQPMLQIENSNMQRQTAAAIESFRNAMVRISITQQPAQLPQQQPPQRHLNSRPVNPPPELIENSGS